MAGGKAEEKSDIAKEIEAGGVVVVSASYCGYCARVKKLLQSLKVKGTIVHETDREGDGDAIRSYIKKKYRQRTVPAVFVGGEFLGGCDDVHKLHRSGKLTTKLRNAGAL